MSRPLQAASGPGCDCFWSTFRAEKSKTRRHLTCLDGGAREVAFNTTPIANMVLQARFVSYVVERALERRGDGVEGNWCGTRFRWKRVQSHRSARPNLFPISNTGRRISAKIKSGLGSLDVSPGVTVLGGCSGDETLVLGARS
jgi:hypothetical protein